MNEQRILNNRYKLLERIGKGGFAEVFSAIDLKLKRQVAIKVLNPEISENESFIVKFEAEAQAVAELDHPNILQVYDYGQAEGTTYLVMPLVKGGTVNDQLQKQPYLDPRLACTYLDQAAAAIDYAHRRFIVHRDIKPQNMLVNPEENRLLLADFGIAKVLSENANEVQTGLAGTLFYMAPEQIAGRVSKFIDIYALGCVAFKLLTGKTPYSGSNPQVMDAHISGRIPSIVERTQGRLPPNLQPVMEKVLAKSPGSRYATAQEFAWHVRMAIFGSVSSPILRQNTEPFTPSAQLFETPRDLQPPSNTPSSTLVYGNNEATSVVTPGNAAPPADAPTIVAGQKFVIQGLEGTRPASITLHFTLPDTVLVAGIRDRNSDHLFIWDNAYPDRFAELTADNPTELMLVSRRHAYFKLINGQVVLFSGAPEANQPSPNGTFVNGKRLEAGQGYTLQPHDLIGFGPRSRGPNRAFSRDGSVTLLFRGI